MKAQAVLASVATILFALALPTANADYDVTKYCELVPTGTRLPSFESCQNFYTCNAFGLPATPGTCSGTQSFDRNSQGCKASSTVNCYYGVSDPCAGKNSAYVPNVDNCRGWIWCVNSAEKGRGECPGGQLFDSATGACIYGTCNNDNDVGSGLDEVQNVCELMQSGTYFGSFEDCGQWNVCTNLDITTGDCDPGLVYNTQRRMCLKNDGTMCQRTNGEAPSTPDVACTAANNKAVMGDSSVCSIWYTCDGTAWQKQQCPTGQYFDIPSGACASRQSATPATGCNRCQYASTTFVNAVDTDCQGYLSCKNGAEVSNGTCATGQFFNEQRQACVVGTTDLTTYRQKNGACAAAADVVTTVEPDVTTDGPSDVETTTDDGKPAENPTTVDPADDETTTVDPADEETTTVEDETTTVEDETTTEEG